MYYTTTYASPLGSLLLASDGNRLIGLWLEGQKYHGAGIGDMTEQPNLPVFALAASWLDRYFCGERPAIAELPLAPIGTDFRKAVWQILCGIPYGTCITYGDIAKAVAAQTGKQGMSGQAIGGAVGHNPISIIIPCHRVVGANGSLTGYAGGLDAKIKLLTHEGADMSRLRRPTRGSAL